MMRPEEMMFYLIQVTNVTLQLMQPSSIYLKNLFAVSLASLAKKCVLLFYPRQWTIYSCLSWLGVKFSHYR